MILKINNQDSRFYTIMGKYFADRSFIKELDCQLYDNNAMWYLDLDDHKRICGFVSVENKGKYMLVDNFYVFEEYRQNGHGKAIIQSAIDNGKTYRLITRNQYAKKIFLSLGFTEVGHNGRYTKMERSPVECEE